MAAKIDWWEVLDLFCWGLDTLSRPSVARALRGFDEDRYRTLGPKFWRRLEAEEWVRRSGQGSEARFTITSKGRDRCRSREARVQWDRAWDQKWRIVTFDVPEIRSKDRVALWREFRNCKLGMLQRSV